MSQEEVNSSGNDCLITSLNPLVGFANSLRKLIVSSAGPEKTNLHLSNLHPLRAVGFYSPKHQFAIVKNAVAVVIVIQ